MYYSVISESARAFFDYWFKYFKGLERLVGVLSYEDFEAYRELLRLDFEAVYSPF